MSTNVLCWKLFKHLVLWVQLKNELNVWPLFHPDPAAGLARWLRSIIFVVEFYHGIYLVVKHRARGAGASTV
jgi:hypothetical protein